MSSTMWTQCGGVDNAHHARVRAWRAVEQQAKASTRKLVDSLADQDILEQMLDETKPRSEVDREPLHYLLRTPFRYPPLKYGSRFGRRHEPSLWYGAEHVTTALVEVSYYQLLFREGSPALAGRAVVVDRTVFAADLRCQMFMDLTRKPYDDFRSVLIDPKDYGKTQDLGSAMRSAGIDAFRYESARDPQGGSNVAAFTPEVFEPGRPVAFQSWRARVADEGVEWERLDAVTPKTLVHNRELFLVDGDLPAAAV